MKIYLLRHGETEGNRKLLYYGSTNLPLLPESIEKLQQNSKNYPRAEKYYTSGMLRTEQTFHAIYGDTPHTALPELREIDFGIFEMHTYEELKDTPEFQNWALDAEHKPCPGGESAVGVSERCVREFERLLARGEDAVCVVHGGVITAILMHYFGGSRYDYNIAPGHGCCIDAPDGRPARWHPVPEEETALTEQEMVDWAVEEGFAAAAIVNTDEIVFDPMFRPYCEENLCGQYGANYSCPPDCGSPEAMKQRILAHKRALVLQTIWQVQDYSDMPTIKQAKKSHNASEIRLVQRLRAAGHDGVMAGASGCAICSPCVLPKGEPCRFPRLQYSCMSAYCIFVRKLAEKCGMEYDCGEGLLGLFGLYAFD